MTYTDDRRGDLGFDRRYFLKGSAAVAVAGLTGPFAFLQTKLQAGELCGTRGVSPYGPLVPAVDHATGLELLMLPRGFQYWTMSWKGDLMNDGNIVPSGHDGMAIVDEGRGGFTLIRNHEVFGLGTPIASTNNYDSQGPAGTTALQVQAGHHLVDARVSISGTSSNCAGGRSPWGTWLTCEETVDVGDEPHGYVFECTPWRVTAPVPLTAMGRFAHEAVAFDPRTGSVYLTEDRGDSLFYRYVPEVYSDLARGGSLWALRLADWPGGIDTKTGFKNLLNVPFAVDWVRIDEPDPASDTVRREGQSKNAAVFSRGEGAWYGNGFVYFVCSNGGEAGRGQVWAYDPAAETLTLVFEAVAASELGYADASWNDGSVASNGGYVHAAPDNITVGPDGRLYLCEDGSGVEKVVGINRAGELFEVMRNELNGSEFCGACFSPDGRLMFVNIQSPGITCVVRGNWREGRR